MKKQYWSHEIVYQIYPRSFCDSNGDGIGDLQGIISKLDYLHDLGIRIIWLSPIYESPQFDIGYDISDYYRINPEYGTMEDFEQLLAEAKKRDIRIVMDLVANHTSNQHRWFLESKNPDSPYHDYYIYKKGKKPGVPPNNWTSNFSGSAWTYVPEIDEWYLHLFAEEQPDLNWHNPKVIEEIEKVIAFYMDKGVYGFRCDVITQIYKSSYEDGKGHAPTCRGSEHYILSEGNHICLRKLYDDVYVRYEDHLVVGETSGITPETGEAMIQNKELDMFFEFDHITHDSIGFVIPTKLRVEGFKNAFYAYQKRCSWNALYLENHDQRRCISRYGDEANHDVSGKCLALFYMCLKGTPFVYQGQEIGMLNKPHNDPRKTSKDICVTMLYKIADKLPLTEGMKRKIINQHDRDHARTPMQWNNGVSAGFSSNLDTWLPVNPCYKTYNVEDELKDPESLLNFYKKLIELRRKDPVLVEGSFDEIPTKGSLICYRRVLGTKSYLVLLNLSKKEIKRPRSLMHIMGKVLLSSYPDSKAYSETKLRPFEAMLIDLE